MTEYDLGKVVGDDGEAGNGIASITKTGTSGLVDTYTITYDDGTTTTFTVTNGSDASVTIQTSWGSTTSDSKVPSEKLTKDTLDTKITKSSTTGLMKNDGTVMTSGTGSTNYSAGNHTHSNYISTSSTTGLIKNDGSIDTNTYLTSSAISGMLTTSDVVDNLTSTSSTAPLSAKQGKVLNDLIGQAISYINQQVVIRITNDTTTLNGALSQLGETMAANITTKGVSASASDGLTTLAGKILQISGDTPTPTPTVLFEDDCSSDRSNEYTTQGTQTITYNSNGYYTIALTTQSCPNVKINSFTAPNTVKISMDMYIQSGSNAQPKIYLFDESQNKGYGLRVTQNNSRWNLQTITSYTDCGTNLIETSLSTSTGTWYTLEVIIDDNDLTGNIYNSGGTLLETITATGGLNLSSTGNYVAIGANYTSNTILRVKNIKVETIGGDTPCAEYIAEIDSAIEYINGSGS